MTEPRICNRECCERQAYARGFCVSHYNSFIKSLRRKGSTLFAAIDTWTEVQKHMPGTFQQLAERTGIAYNTVLRTVNRKHKEGAAHIVDHEPPKGRSGRWVRIFAAGAGVDHTVSAKRKKGYRLRGRCASHLARVAAKNAPQIVTRWNLAFFNPAEIRT